MKSLPCNYQKRIRYNLFLILFLILSLPLLEISCTKNDDDPPSPPEDIYTAVRRIGTASLSQARSYLVAGATGNKIVFAGGRKSEWDDLMGWVYFESDRVDIYDAGSNTWSIDSLPVKRHFPGAVSVSDKILFAGGTDAYSPTYVTNRIDVYDGRTEQWLLDSLSEGRQWVRGAAAGNIAVFGGGFTGYSTADKSRTVDIYNAATHSWSTSQLSRPGANLAVAANKGKIYFASFAYSYYEAQSNLVDIYDTHTNSWEQAQLSEARPAIAAAAAGDLVLFAGGGGSYQNENGTVSYRYSKVVDIFDTKNKTWSVDSLSEPRANTAAVAIGNKIFFGGGVTYPSNASKALDIYDVITRKWTKDSLSAPRNNLAAGAAGNKVLFAGGYQSGEKAVVDIFEVLK